MHGQNTSFTVGDLDTSRPVCFFFSGICSSLIASFPRSPLNSVKNKNGGGERGFNLYMILRHDAFTLTIKQPETSLT